MIENGMTIGAEADYNSVFCPVCGEECEFIFKKDGDVIGCENCVEQISADYWHNEEEENKRLLDDDRRFEEARDLREALYG